MRETRWKRRDSRTVHAIVRSHDGFLTVDSEVGTGSMFRVFLPATDELPVATEPSAAPSDGTGQTILVVDDEAHIRAATQRILERHGYRVRTAATGRDAIEVFGRERICAVVLDQSTLSRVGVLLLALPLLTVAVLARNRYRLTLVRTVTPQLVAAGQPARVALTLANDGIAPNGVLLMEDHVPYVLGTRPRFVAEGIGQGWRHSVTYQVRSDVLRSREIAQRHHLPQNLVVTGWIASMLLQMEGRLDEAERAIEEIAALDATLAMASQGIELAQLANLRELQGRLPELEEVLEAVAGFHPAFVEIHAMALLQAGRVDELRLRLGSYAEQRPVHRDYMWLGLMSVRARIWSALGDADAIADLRAQLAPYADQLTGTIAVTFQGSVHRTLGLLALAAEDREAAAGHLRAAREVHERLGLDLWVARTEELLAQV